MGGALTLESTPGQGTRVRLRLPLVPIEVPADADSPLAPRLRLLPREGKPACRLLVVEDDPDSRNILVQTLAALGAQVLQAGQGEEALAQMERLAQTAQAGQPPVDLVFTDIRMPVLDGLGLLRQIRQHWGEALPVVAVSASSLEHERRFYVGEGFQDFVGKPYDLQEIYRLLRRYLPERWVEAKTETETAIGIDADTDPAPACAGSPPPDAGVAAAVSLGAASHGATVPDAAAPASRSPDLTATLQRLASAAREGDVAAVRQAMQALRALQAAQPPAATGLDSDTARRLTQAVQHYDFDTLAALVDQRLAAPVPGAVP